MAQILEWAPGSTYSGSNGFGRIKEQKFIDPVLGLWLKCRKLKIKIKTEDEDLPDSMDRA